jgi:hypothetical protein
LLRFTSAIEQFKQIPGRGPEGLLVGDSIRGSFFEPGKTEGGPARLRQHDGSSNE